MAERVQALERLLSSCTVCPHDCGDKKMEDHLARCYSGRLASKFCFVSDASYVSPNPLAPILETMR